MSAKGDRHRKRGRRKMLLRCLDLETTGEEPDIGIVEVGWCDLRQNGEGWHIVPPQKGGVRPYASFLVNPGQPITPETSAIHHITNEDVIAKLTPPHLLTFATHSPPPTTL